MPWDQALEILLRAKGLDQRRDGNVVWVAPQAELSAYELAQNTARIKLENSGELVAEYIPINYGSATDLVTIIMPRPGRRRRRRRRRPAAAAACCRRAARVSADVRTNTLLISDTRKKIDEIRRMLDVLDRPVDQVLIEARIVIADETFARDLGARFGFEQRRQPEPRPAAPTPPRPASTSTWALAPAAACSTSASSTPPARNLRPRAVGAAGRRPRRSGVQPARDHHQPARGHHHPGRRNRLHHAAGGRRGQAIATPAFKEALLELKVTPTITTDGRVFMAVNIKKDDIKGFTLGVPSLTKRSVTTGVMVDSGDTVVIGGVYEFRNRKDISQVAVARRRAGARQPVQEANKSHSKAELLVFVTPRVLQVAKR